jgi:hypothetical protein
MDSNDEFTIQAIMENEANATVDEDEHLKIISCLLLLQVELNAANKHGGLKFGTKRSRNDIGWRTIACSTPTIFPMSQYIPPKGFSAAI